MKYIFSFFFLFTLTFTSGAQNCNCNENFRFMVEKVKRNYVGYSDKVTSENSQRYQNFTDSLLKVSNLSNSYECLNICREWLSFFKDRHLGFGIGFDKLSPDSVRHFFSKAEKTNWSESEFKNYLLKNKNTIDSIEGIWTHEKNIYKLGLVRDQLKPGKEFIAFIIVADGSRWISQQIKFRLIKKGNQYETIYFNAGDHSRSLQKLIKQKDTLNFGMFGKWIKGDSNSKSLATYLDPPRPQPKFSKLDNETSLITLPSFDLQYKSKIDSLIKQNKQTLENSKHLIIDIRNNPGGSITCFEKLIPYLYTNPITIDGASVLATEDNLRDSYEKSYPNAPDSLQKLLKINAKKLRQHLGELYPLYPPDTIVLSSILKKPSRISVLINGNTASSGEHFILRAEQSKKVTIFGQNSAGSIDYTETVSSKMPCNFYTLTYPASKSLRIVKRPLNNIGIAPNVIIPNNVNDWIEYVKNYNLKK